MLKVGQRIENHHITWYDEHAINVASYLAELAKAISGQPIRLLDLVDPDALSEALFGIEIPDAVATPMLPIGTRRQVTRTAAKALAPEATLISLPDTAPYGAVLVDTDACTLCLSCVSLCPSGALGDNPDLPQLRFQEDACLQCGLCSNICPEQAITLQPQLNLTDAAFTQVVLHEEEPFACVECGNLFGVKSTVEKIIEKEKPQALLPTMGGQTALNCALDLVREGVLEKHGVEMIGATREAIDIAVPCGDERDRSKDTKSFYRA